PHHDGALVSYWERTDEDVRPEPCEYTLHILWLNAAIYGLEDKYNSWFKGLEVVPTPLRVDPEEEAEMLRDFEEIMKLEAELKTTKPTDKPSKLLPTVKLTRSVKHAMEIEVSTTATPLTKHANQAIKMSDISTGSTTAKTMHGSSNLNHEAKGGQWPLHVHKMVTRSRANKEHCNLPYLRKEIVEELAKGTKGKRNSVSANSVQEASRSTKG
ncbi:hypothetical protein BG006_005024, partial [Podila minutissima]